MLVLVSFIYLCLLLFLPVNGQYATVWNNLRNSDSNTFFTTLANPRFSAIQNILSTHENITLFLPTESAIQDAIKSNLFSTTNTSINEVLYHIVNSTHDLKFLLSKRQYLNTLSSQSPLLVAGPDSNNSTHLQVLAGPTTANIIGYTNCNNGMIYKIDKFLVSPISAMDTISFLDDLNRLENTIKAQNLSNIVLGSNKTIFAPVDSAWNAVNGTSLPFGTIVHFLKYQVIEGIYYQKDLIGKNQTFTTNYLSNPITVETDVSGHLHIVTNITGQPNIVADIVQSDILTSGGVIHLVNRIMLRQANTDANANSKFKLVASPTSSSSSHVKAIPLHYLLLFLFMHYTLFSYNIIKKISYLSS